MSPTATKTATARAFFGAAGECGHPRRGARFHAAFCHVALTVICPLDTPVAGFETRVAKRRRDEARAQVEFGIQVAMRGLWNEAVFRWERAIELDPTYAEAWNNLAIAFENQGRFEDALEAYETALDLDPQNIQIETNYDLFLEVSDRVNQSDP